MRDGNKLARAHFAFHHRHHPRRMVLKRQRKCRARNWCALIFCTVELWLESGWPECGCRADAQQTRPIRDGLHAHTLTDTQSRFTLFSWVFEHTYYIDLGLLAGMVLWCSRRLGRTHSCWHPLCVTSDTHTHTQTDYAFKSCCHRCCDYDDEDKQDVASTLGRTNWKLDFSHSLRYAKPRPQIASELENQ